jgi:hypothetical protein
VYDKAKPLAGKPFYLNYVDQLDHSNGFAARRRVRDNGPAASAAAWCALCGDAAIRSFV